MLRPQGHDQAQQGARGDKAKAKIFGLTSLTDCLAGEVLLKPKRSY